MKEKGAALAELLVVIPVLVSLWFGLYHFSKVMALKQKMLVTARYGVFLAKNGASDEEVIIKTRAANMLGNLADHKLMFITPGKDTAVYKNGRSLPYNPFVYSVSADLTTSTFAGFSGFLIHERFSMAKDCWQIHDMNKHRKYQADSIGAGTYKPEDAWRQYGE